MVNEVLLLTYLTKGYYTPFRSSISSPVEFENTLCIHFLYSIYLSTSGSSRYGIPSIGGANGIGANAQCRMYQLFSTNLSARLAASRYFWIALQHSSLCPTPHFGPPRIFISIAFSKLTIGQSYRLRWHVLLKDVFSKWR